MRAVFERAKVILEGEDAYLCIGIPFQEAKAFTATMKPKKYAVEIKEYRERRSLDANAYLWTLLGKLSAVLHIPPEEIYRDAIRDVGGNYEVMPVRNEALDKWKNVWQGNGLGWVCEEVGPSKIEGYTNVRNFYGSSAYDTAQMSRLIEIVVSECKGQGIETMKPEELARLMEENRCKE